MTFPKNRFANAALTFLFISLCCGCGIPPELQGTWAGHAVGEPQVDWILTIAKDQFQMTTEGSAKCLTGTLALNSNCTLRKIDLEYCDQPLFAVHKRISYGIYKIEDETLTLVAGQPGEPKRPHSFEDPDDAIIFIFEKIKDVF
jgi:uncharacterized protein (TIGR03067 family)